MDGILVDVDKVHRLAIDWKSHMENMPLQGGRPPNGLKGRECLPNQDHTALKSVVRGATVKQMVPREAPGVAESPVSPVER